MKSNFERCFQWCLAHEGGFSNHPKDPGGATNKGVTQRVYDAFRKRQGKATRSVSIPLSTCSCDLLCIDSMFCSLSSVLFPQEAAGTQ